MTDDNAGGIVANDLTVTGHTFLRRLVLLILAGVFLMGGHPYPAGTLAFGCFFLAAAWLELTPRVITGARAKTTEHKGTPKQREARNASAGRR